VLQELTQLGTELYKQNAFVHWYTEKGRDWKRAFKPGKNWQKSIEVEEA